jgi:DNA-binding NtrC family response regulator
MRQVNRILLVEDDDMLRKVLARVLKAGGYDVVAAASKAEALAALQGATFQLLIIDVVLPDGSGIEVVRTASKLRPAPLMVVVSGLASRKEIFAAAQEGALAFLEKPFDGPELIATIELVSSKGRVVGLEPMVPALVGYEGMRDVVDRVRSDMTSQAMAMTAGNKSDAARLLGVSRQAVQQIKKRESVG